MKHTSFWFLTLLVTASPALAQPDQPIGPYVVDARGTLARFKEDPLVALPLEVTPTNLPTRGLGLTGGVHWYPLRTRTVALGLGGEIVLARDSRSREPESGDEDAPGGPTVTTRFTALSPQVSLNFGRRDGWSYISGGIGLVRLVAERADAPFGEAAARTRGTNYGGGARWFTGPRLAFAVDLRFWAINAREATAAVPAFPRTRMMVISAGVSLR